MRIVAWGDDRSAELTRLWNVAAPDEPLTHAEIATVCFDGAGVVLASDDGAGAVAAVVRRPAGSAGGRAAARGHVRLLVVHPDSRRQALGLRLLAAAEGWLADQGAGTATLGAEAPIYLWPGIDAADLAMQALAVKAGYSVTGGALNLSLPSSFRAQVPPGVDIRRPDDPDSAAAVQALVAEDWPIWLTELDLGLRRGTVFGAFAGPDPREPPPAVGFCCHSTLRRGWVGPLGVRAEQRRRGVGAALLSAVCADLEARDFDEVEAVWVGPLAYFADLGSRTSRVFLRYSRSIGPRA